MKKSSLFVLLGSIVLGALVAVTIVVGVRTQEVSVDKQASGQPPTAAKVARTASVVMNGDLLWHESVYESGMQPNGTWDYTQTFAPMRDIISEADLAICHQEVPLAPPEGPFSGYPQFSAPPQTLDGVKAAGYDMCTTASNHTIDAGPAGIDRTNEAMDKAGLLHVGGARTPEEAAKPVIFTTKEGVRIGVVTGTYGTNGLPVPEPWMVPNLDPQRIIEQAKITREAGADIVMAAIHAGDEGMTQPNDQQVSVADALTKSEYIDLVYGHHAHAVQPITKVNGKWVIYGLGNFLANQQVDNYLAYDGLTVRIQFDEKPEGGFGVEEVRYIPTLITPYNQMPVQASALSTLDTANDPRAAESLARTREAVMSMGGAQYAELREG